MRSALADFQSEISRIDKVADWLITPDALESKMMPATVAIRCGAVVLLSGYFETFLKDCMCKFITQVNGLGKPLSTLPGKMKITHFENGARALSKEIRKAKKINDTSLCEDLAARLASVSASTGYTLAWKPLRTPMRTRGRALSVVCSVRLESKILGERSKRYHRVVLVILTYF